MCLGIPGRIVGIADAARQLGVVEVAGVRREVNLACILEEGQPPSACVGIWVIVHVGFAMSRIDEAQAARTLEVLAELGALQQELDALAGAAGEGQAMKYVDEFRDPAKARTLFREIAALAGRIATPGGRPLQIMEVCGGHTHSIFRYGLEALLPERIELVHGPGCPVCVLPRGRVDDGIALAERPEVIFATFGDALRVPGSRGSLLQAKAEGADVRLVYSPLDALGLARDNPGREVVFFALGFETTMPGTALTVLQAEAEGLANFSLFCNHITIIPTLRAILESPDLGIDGFLGPGHVSMVIGNRPYGFVAERYRRPLVIAGFEPLDILQSLWMLLKQLEEGRCEIENQYDRVVPEAGNRRALDAVERVFELRPCFEWRGLGSIDRSGLRLAEAYARFDAERRFPLPRLSVADPADCQCGAVLTGALRPRQCRLFGKACTPATPLGALMVSSEGACAASYRYGGGGEAAA